MSVTVTGHGYVTRKTWTIAGHGNNLLGVPDLDDVQFGKMLDRAIAGAGFKSLSAFARAVGSTPTTISKCIRAERRPPLDDLEKWADGLRLKDAGRSEFLRLGRKVKAADAKSQPHIQDLEREIDGLRMRVDLLVSVLGELRQTTLNKGLKLPQTLLDKLTALEL